MGFGRLYGRVRDQWPIVGLGLIVCYLLVEVSTLKTTIALSRRDQVRERRALADFASPEIQETFSGTSLKSNLHRSKASDRKESRDVSTSSSNVLPSQPMTKSMGMSNNREYEWPIPLEEWALVPDGKEDVSPLKGEGIVSEHIRSLPRDGLGVLFNAIHRDPDAPRGSKKIQEAIAGAQRMKQAIKESGKNSTLQFLLMTEKAPFLFMNNPALCKPMWPECVNFSTNIKVFDHVHFYDDLEMPPIIDRRERFQTWPALWLKRIVASLHSPFARTLVVDSDVYACSNFQDLFTDYLGRDTDVGITLAPAPFGASRNYPGAFRPGFPKSYEQYTERNLGLHLLATQNPLVIRLLALFRDVYIRQANNTEHVSIGNDQCAFREAMWTLKAEGLVESTIPADVGCRHETGCADGCYVVHRHSHPELSRAELQALKAAKRAASKEEEQRK